MAVNKENAAPEVTVGAATGQHLCNSEISISNEAPAGNKNFAGPEVKEIFPIENRLAEGGETVPKKSLL